MILMVLLPWTIAVAIFCKLVLVTKRCAELKVIARSTSEMLNSECKLSSELAKKNIALTGELAKLKQWEGIQ